MDVENLQKPEKPMATVTKLRLDDNGNAVAHVDDGRIEKVVIGVDYGLDVSIGDHPSGIETPRYDDLISISRESYAEIEHVLKENGFDHCLVEGGIIDMSGIRFKRADDVTQIFSIVLNGERIQISPRQGGEVLGFEQICGMAGIRMGHVRWIAWQHGNESGKLLLGDTIVLKQHMAFSINTVR